MDLNIGAFYAFWNAADVEKAPGTNKISYREMGGFKFQFRRLDYRAQTKLSLRIASLAKQFEPLFSASDGFLEAEDLAEDATVEQVKEHAKQVEQIEAYNRAKMLKLLPELLGSLDDPKIESLLNDLVSSVAVDRGNGTFEDLSNPAVAATVFDEDITLQLPVAATAAEVNLSGFFQKLAKGLNLTP